MATMASAPEVRSLPFPDRPQKAEPSGCSTMGRLNAMLRAQIPCVGALLVLDSDGVLSDEGGGRGGDDDSSDGALSDIGDAAAAFARKGADALTRLAATKTFMCHIHNIKLQSLEPSDSRPSWYIPPQCLCRRVHIRGNDDECVPCDPIAADCGLVPATQAQQTVDAVSTMESMRGQQQQAAVHVRRPEVAVPRCRGDESPGVV